MHRFRQFLTFTEQRLHKAPSRLNFQEIDTPLIMAFLDHLEKHQGVSARSRNLRLTAIRSFFRFAAFEVPTYYNFMLLAVQTGLRLSEITGLKREDIILGAGAHVRVIGKGRKERCTPIAKSTLKVLKGWLREPQRGDGHVLFPNFKGERLSVHGVQYLLNKHRTTASAVCLSLKRKRVTVHRLRHTMAMDLLQAGVDRSVIALWLGHARLETTQVYREATLAMKEKALAKVTPQNGRRGRYKPGDKLLAFLNGL